jgi:PQQ-dependent catabolism-associated CXXCW motif protein
MQWERQDMGVPPTRQLHTGAMHGPTPTQIPGGQVITTKGLVPLMQGGQVQVLVFDVLGAPQQLPNAIPAAAAAQAGSFNDATQQQFGQMLQQLTRGRNDIPLVFYCQGPQCWMSYNAALRAINLGYRNVLWYRGGIEAWQRGGLPLGQSQYTQGGAPPGGQPYGGAPPQGGGYPGGQPYGGAPPQGGGYPGGQPYGGAPPQGGPYPGGQTYGGPPPQGGPYPGGTGYGGPPPQGGPSPGGQPYGGAYGGPPQGGSPGGMYPGQQSGGYPPR